MRRYVNVRTTLLTFASFGNTAGIPCDYLGLEEEAASPSVIEAIRGSGRQVLVWTPNEERSQRHFLLSDADYIITDRVSDAMQVKKELAERDRLIILLDYLFSFM